MMGSPIILIFLLINGHHMIIRALFYSYDVIPLGQLTFSSDVISELGVIMAEMFFQYVMISGHLKIVSEFVVVILLLADTKRFIIIL